MASKLFISVKEVAGNQILRYTHHPKIDPANILYKIQSPLNLLGHLKYVK